MVRLHAATKDERHAAPETEVRRPYASPSLRYLGTVYELTLTGPGSGTEPGPFPKPGG